jgi:methyl-accepting chemotaxis protein/methyl-accepting chemotaxis protein-1 (serine sensor receptor)
MQEHLTSDEGRRLAERADAVLNAWAGALQRLLALTWANKDAKEVGAHVEAEIAPLMAEADQVSEALTRQQKQFLAESASAAESNIRRSRSVAIGLSIVSLLIGATGLVVVRRATGQLRSITKDLANGATQVASASRQISGASQSQATGASQQAAALEETSSASEQVSATSRENAASARQAADATSQVRRSLQEVTKTMAEAVEAMGRINHSSTRISAILKVIDEIAFQTNILALNASVEAARAGEAGLGFAVVADEVRSLAQRCAQASKDTSGLVDDSIGSAGDGKKRLEVLAASVTSMTTAADSVQSLAAAVLEGSVQQAKGMEQISRAVHEMQRTTQGSAASAEEGASAGEELSAQASELNHVVESLSAIVGA